MKNRLRSETEHPHIAKLLASIPRFASDGGEPTPMELQLSIAPTWEAVLGFLINSQVVPIPEINKRAALLWNLVGSNVTQLAVDYGSMQVRSMHFLGTKQGDDPWRGAIIAPSNYCEKVRQDPWMQLGAAVFLAEQASEYWALRLEGFDENRALGLESLFLRWASTQPGFEANTYQAKVLNKNLVYENRDFPPFSNGRARENFVSFSGEPIRIIQITK